MSHSTAESQRPLEIGLSVVPREGCPVRSLGPEIADVRHHAHEEGLQCEIDFVDPTEEAEKTFHAYNHDEDDCPATIFMRHDSVLNVRRVENEELIVVTHPPDRATAQSLLGDLKAVAERVDIKWIEEDPVHSGESRRSVDLATLTDKQREAVRTAVECGYYEQPRQTTVTELAAECEISQSAMSQRLHAAERKLLGALF